MSLTVWVLFIILFGLCWNTLWVEGVLHNIRMNIEFAKPQNDECFDDVCH